MNITEILVLPGRDLCTGAAVMIDHVSIEPSQRDTLTSQVCASCALANNSFYTDVIFFSHMFSSEALMLLVLYTEIKSITHSIVILK